MTDPAEISLSNKEILYIVTEDWFFASHFLPRAQAAVQAGYKVSVATRIHAHGDVISGEGINLIPLPWKRRRSNPFREVKTLMLLIKTLRQNKSAIVHNFALKPIIYGTLSAKIAGARRIVNAPVGMGFVDGSDKFKARLLRKPVLALLALFLNPRGSRVIFENPDALETFCGTGLVRHADARLIRGAGVDLAEYAPAVGTPTNERITVILVARMLVEKGVLLFHEAALKLAGNSSPRLRFLLVGEPDEGNDHSVATETLREWHDRGDLEWLGRRTDVADLLRASDIFCLPTYYGEGLPKALLEAAAARLPIITTDSPGCREVVIDGVNGILIPPRDVTALVNAIQELAENRSLRQRYGERSLELAQTHFTVDTVNAATMDVYAELHM